MQKSIAKKLGAINALMQKHHIIRAYLFGSVLTDKFNRKSDIDFLVSIDEGLSPEEQGEHLLTLWDELESVTRRKVDLLTERSLTNPYLIKSIDATKLVIYER